MRRKARCPTCGDPCNVLWFQEKVLDARGEVARKPTGKTLVQWVLLENWWVCKKHREAPFHAVVPQDAAEDLKAKRRR